MSEATHPDWYYEYYDRVFSREGDYLEEVQQVLGCIPFPIETATEIGAGLGGHAHALQASGVRRLQLIDVDPVATRHLRETFRSVDVAVLECDGFSIERGEIPPSELVLCMYSVVQQVTSMGALAERIRSLRWLCDRPGAIAIEFIDRDASIRTYPEGSTTRVLSDGADVLEVQSSYPPNAVHITYSGTLAGRRAQYTARLVAVAPQEVVGLLVEAGFRPIRTLTMDPHGRRRIAVALCEPAPGVV